MVLHGKTLQEYPVYTGVSPGFIRGPKLFVLNINNLSEGLICNIAISADDTTFYCTYYQTSDLRHQLESQLDETGFST